MTTETVAPNTIDGAAQQHNAIPSLESLAAKMTAMREEAQRNRQQTTGTIETAPEASSPGPVAPETVEQSAEPEHADTPETTASAEAADESAQEDPVSDTRTDTTAEEIIDFIEFAESNPQAKFRFMRNGKEMVIDAKKAAAILGQGGAIHEEARELKIQRSEFEEYERNRRAELDGLALAMEFTVEPRIQQAYDEIVKTQGYQAQFHQRLAATQDPAEQARIRASMQQNERYIAQQGDTIRRLKPQVDQFRDHRRQQVRDILDNNRRQFSDRELRNEYVYNELRETISKGWAGAREQLIPGVENLDLVTSDEYILGLLRDGLKFRDRPKTNQAGASIAQLQSRKGTAASGRGEEDNIRQLREQAKGGDKKAADNLLVAQLSRLRASRRA